MDLDRAHWSLVTGGVNLRDIRRPAALSRLIDNAGKRGARMTAIRFQRAVDRKAFIDRATHTTTSTGPENLKAALLKADALDGRLGVISERDYDNFERTAAAYQRRFSRFVPEYTFDKLSSIEPNTLLKYDKLSNWIDSSLKVRQELEAATEIL